MSVFETCLAAEASSRQKASLTTAGQSWASVSASISSSSARPRSFVPRRTASAFRFARGQASSAARAYLGSPRNSANVDGNDPTGANRDGGVPGNTTDRNPAGSSSVCRHVSNDVVRAAVFVFLTAWSRSRRMASRAARRSRSSVDAVGLRAASLSSYSSKEAALRRWVSFARRSNALASVDLGISVDAVFAAAVALTASPRSRSARPARYQAFASVGAAFVARQASREASS
mmetsp:Transcript_38294/g.122793  ORF Transcript_38294/g.122793 Transcript_38294/m.122793 type:complete len:232 (+) Transcript_38294:972-1667(+)